MSIRARLTNGTFLIGIDAENVRRLCAGEPMHFDLRKTGGTDVVVIQFGITLEEVMRSWEIQNGGPLPKAGRMDDTGENG